MSHVTTPRTRRPRRSGPSKVVSLPDLVDGWVTDGIISPQQADRMLSGSSVTVRTTQTTEQRPQHLAVESLGYLGGVISVVGALGIAAQYWSELSTGTRLTVVGAAAAALLAGGFAVTAQLGGLGVRLRSVLWLGSTIAMSGFLGLLGSEPLGLEGADVAVLAGAGTAVIAAGLWRLHGVLVQQVAMMVAVMVVSAASIAAFVMADSLPGLGVWGVGAIWLVLGWGGLLSPRRAVLALGGTSMIVGAMITMAYDAGIVLALATAAVIVLLAVVFSDLVLLVVGAVGALAVLPAALTKWFPDTISAPLALLGFGVVLVGAAIGSTRRGRGRVAARSPDHSVGQPAVALAAAAAVLLAVTATVVTIALS